MSVIKYEKLKINIGNLRKHKGLIKGRLTTIKYFIIKATEDTNKAPEEVTCLQPEKNTYSQGISHQHLITGDKPRDQAEDSKFDERYFTVKAALLQLMDKLKPRSAGPSADVVGGSNGNAIMMQVLEQQAILIQRLTEHNDNDVLVRIMEQQNQLLERLSTQLSTFIREAQVKLSIIKLPIGWKCGSDILIHSKH